MRSRAGRSPRTNVEAVPVSAQEAVAETEPLLAERTMADRTPESEPLLATECAHQDPASASRGAGRSRRAGISISDAATTAGVSPRTLRYYEELGLLTPSLHTRGGQRRYTEDDLAHLDRILELREVLGMNLDEIREFLSLETRLDELRATYRATKASPTKARPGRAEGHAPEALTLNESLAEHLNAKLARMDAFRAKLAGSAERCRLLLEELGDV